MRLRLVVAAASFVAAALPLSQAAAAPPATLDRPVAVIATGEVVGTATLARSDSGLQMTLHTTGLPAGDAATVWWVIFNRPDSCSTHPCGEPDLFNEAALPSVHQAAGHVIGGDGAGDFGGHLSVGDTDRPWSFYAGPGILSPRTAEVWLAVHQHGPAVPGIVESMIHSFAGGCSNLPPFPGPTSARRPGLPCSFPRSEWAMTTPHRTERISRRQFVRGAGAAGAFLFIPSLGGRAAAATRMRFPRASEFEADVPATWFDFALDLVQATGGYSPPVASRALGCAGLTLYEAIVPGMVGYRSLTQVLPALDQVPAAGRNEAYDWPTVANAALAAILRQLFRTAPAAKLAELDALEARVAARLEPSLPPGVAARSTERGRDVAASLFDWSRADGGHEAYLRNFPPYDPPVGPGLWVPTPPGLLPALQPFWGRNRCLLLPGGDACPPGDHPPYSDAVGSSFHSEALEVYETRKGLTPE